jgi:hypothetical protein
LTIQADGKSKVYGQALPALTATYAGLVTGDTPASLSGALLCTTTANALSPVSGSPYPITCSGQTSTNYTITFVGANLTITQAVSKVVVSTSLTPSILNQSVTFTATVSDNSLGSTGTPTGSVSFYLDSTSGTLLGTANLTATVSGAVGSIATSAVPVNSHSIFAVYGGDGNFVGNNGSVAQLVQYAPAGLCAAGPGHQILQPINSDGTSIYPRKQGSTIPVKFRVCDTYGNSIGPTSVMLNNMGLVMTAVWSGTTPVGTLEDILSTTPDPAFRWDGQQWIFNMSTKDLGSGYTYDYQINLLDGTSIPFRIGLK